MQELAWYGTLLVVAAIAAVFIRVVLLSGRKREYAGVQGSAYMMRSWLFWVLILAGLVIAAVSLRALPYVHRDAPPPAQVVNVTAYQWYWDLDGDAITAGQPVEFRVTSGDVNHGLGIYDAQTRLVAQVQAMPGYVNRLRHTFEEPGTYRLLCLEYCGTQHHDMVEELEVTAPGAGDSAPASGS